MDGQGRPPRAMEDQGRPAKMCRYLQNACCDRDKREEEAGEQGGGTGERRDMGRGLMMKPTTIANTKNNNILNNNPAILPSPVGLTIPDTTANIMIPITSSMIAPPRIEIPCFDANCFMSLRTETEILTDVAVKIVPIYIAPSNF